MRTRSYRTKEGSGEARILEAIPGPEPCAIPRCPDHAVETLRLLVDGSDSVLLVCQTHAEWLGRYFEEDADVQLVARLPPSSSHP
jgi:hypothetical protein